MNIETDEFSYPWYFGFNCLEQVWNLSEGEHANIGLMDSCIDINHIALVGKVDYSNATICTEKIDKRASEIEDNIIIINDIKSSQKAKAEAQKNIANKYANFIHGTAMAGLIVAKSGSYAEDPTKQSENNKNINVAGIAPKASIVATEGISSSDLESLFTQVNKEAQNGKPLFKTHSRIEPLLINISAGQKKIEPNLSSEQDKLDSKFKDLETAWLELIRMKCKENVLIITAVGNNGIGLTKDNLNKGVLPSILKKPKSCGSRDIFLRVGATNYFKATSEIDKYINSNYGSDYVDILAPGANIPILTPNNHATIAGGTSEATAIVTAAAALLASCRQFSNGELIKKALLDNADYYPQLEPYVFGGRVLNISRAVENFCKIKPSIKNITSDIWPFKIETSIYGEVFRFF